MVAAGAADLVELLEGARAGCRTATSSSKSPGHEPEALGELVPDLLAELGAGVLLDRVVHDLRRSPGRPSRAARSRPGEPRRQQAAVGEVVDRRHDLLARQVAGDAEQHHAARPGDPRGGGDPEDRRLPRIAGPCGMVLFGVTGDLSRKKVMPAIYDLANRGLLPPGFSLVGFARRDWANEDFAQIVHDAVKEHARTEFREEVWKQLAEGFRFVPGDFDDDTRSATSRRTIEELDEVRGTGGNHAFYLSIPPGFFGDGHRPAQGARPGRAPPTASWRRVVVEKPFGHDLESARGAATRRRVGVPVRVGVPDRPLPRQGDGAEHPGDAVRQRRCSSRSGTPTTSTTCRSRWPRTSASAAAPATTTASAPPATSSRTTCSS